MRDIRFRAWYKEKEQMCYPGEDPEFDQGYWDGLNMSEVYMLNRCLKLDRIQWMQYTGLKDKNGKEIYEGDVIEVKYETSSWGRKIKYNFIGKVVFGSFSTEEREGCSEDIEGWYILAPCEVTNEMTDTYSLADHNHNCEIISNVHENPELIKL